MCKFITPSTGMQSGSQIPVQYESLYPALKEQYGSSFEPVLSEDGKTVVLADPYFQDHGRILIYRKSDLGAYELLQIVVGNFFENEKGFGTVVDIKADGNTIAVMSESVTLVRYKKIQQVAYTVRIYTRTPIGQYLCRAHVFPRFVEEGSEYADQLMLSSDGKVLFISAPNKENDATTGADGSTGAVYTFKVNEKTQTYEQHQLIRPPHEGISRFGQTIGSEKDGNFYALDQNGVKRTFEFKTLAQPVQGFNSGWVFEKEESL